RTRLAAGFLHARLGRFHLCGGQCHRCLGDLEALGSRINIVRLLVDISGLSVDLRCGFAESLNRRVEGGVAEIAVLDTWINRRYLHYLEFAGTNGSGVSCQPVADEVTEARVVVLFLSSVACTHPPDLSLVHGGSRYGSPEVYLYNKCAVGPMKATLGR